MTAVRADQYKTFQADIIVMASGGSCPVIPRGLQRHDGHVLVIDIDDQATPMSKQETASRRWDYESLFCNSKFDRLT
jgi:hypothetical protein